MSIPGLTYLKTPAGVVAKGRGAFLDPGYLEGWGFPTFEDNFDGDLSKWTVRDQATHGNLSYDWAKIDRNAATVSGGQLRIRATLLPEPIVSGGRTRHWATGYLDTMSTHSMLYGRWEYRAKIPTTRGNSRAIWPAFWLRNGNVGEIDIMESWGDPPKTARNVNLTETSTVTLHESTNGGTNKVGFTYEHRTKLKSPNTSAYDTASGFHTWALEYTPDFLKAYLDGVLAIHIVPTGELVSGAIRDYSWVWGPTFTSPWAMRLNLQIGDPYWSPDPTPSSLTAMPADYLVDYVRAWEYQG